MSPTEESISFIGFVGTEAQITSHLVTNEYRIRISEDRQDALSATRFNTNLVHDRLLYSGHLNLGARPDFAASEFRIRCWSLAISFHGLLHDWMRCSRIRTHSLCPESIARPA